MVRKADEKDISEIMMIYGGARNFMRRSGNMRQWINGYPSEETVREDIREKRLYVLSDDEGLYGVFMMQPGIDPTYLSIRDGSWKDDSEYAVIHRIASSGRRKGVLREAVEYTWKTVPHIRIDTHADNIPMQRALLRENFVRCGIIVCSDGTDRIAFERLQHKAL